MPINIDLYQNFDGTLDGRYKQGDKPDSGLATWPDNFTYAGAFRVPANVSGGRMGYSAGVMGLNGAGDSMYMSLHPTEDRGICELSLPTTLSTSADVSDLPYATEVQGRFDVFNTPDGNPDGNDMIAGMYEHGGKLIVSLGQRYDGDDNNTLFYTVMGTPTNFTTTTYEGHYAVEGAYKACGWTSPIPPEWQSQLGYTHIIGHSDNHSRLGRSSLGPSAYGINLDNVTAPTVTQPIPTEAFQVYPVADGSLAQAVNPATTYEEYNTGNPVLSVLGTVGYGFIIPGTRTYACFGSQIGGNGTTYRQDLSPSGNHADDPNDWNFAYWFFDIDDWLDVKNGNKQPHTVAPYAYGPINLQFGGLVGADAQLKILSGAFDPVLERLYLSVGKNYALSPYEKSPLVYAFDLNLGV